MSEQGVVLEPSAVEEPKRDLGFLQYHEQMRAKCSHGWKDEPEPVDAEPREESTDHDEL